MTSIIETKSLNNPIRDLIEHYRSEQEHCLEQMKNSDTYGHHMYSWEDRINQCKGAIEALMRVDSMYIGLGERQSTTSTREKELMETIQTLMGTAQVTPQKIDKPKKKYI
jgi:hypothetical protein